MRKKITLSLIMMLLTVFAIKAQNNESDIMGSWRVISSKLDGVNQNLSNTIKTKLITKKHFSWFSCTEKNRIARNSVGGTYTFDGKVYIETIDCVGVGSTNYLGKKHVFNVKIDGNKMYVKGTLSTKVKLDEVWERTE